MDNCDSELLQMFAYMTHEASRLNPCGTAHEFTTPEKAFVVFREQEPVPNIGIESRQPCQPQVDLVVLLWKTLGRQASPCWRVPRSRIHSQSALQSLSFDRLIVRIRACRLNSQLSTLLRFRMQAFFNRVCL
jgi:hypothetical protein